jgi:hypothetical protein
MSTVNLAAASLSGRLQLQYVMSRVPVAAGLRPPFLVQFLRGSIPFDRDRGK